MEYYSVVVKKRYAGISDNIKDNIWHLHIYTGKFECQKDIHFKTQPRHVAMKNATPSPSSRSWTRVPGSLGERSTDWVAEAVAMYIFLTLEFTLL